MIPGKGGTPLQPHVSETTRYCPVCAKPTQHRRHKIGVRNGVQRYRERCRPCHNAKRV